MSAEHALRPPEDAVVVSGLGAFSACGLGTEPILAALKAGTRPLGPITRFATEGAGLRTTLGLCAEGWQPGEGRAANPWPWALQQAVTVARQAAEQAGLASVAYPRRRIGVLMGTTHGSGGPLDAIEAALAEQPADPERLKWSAAEAARLVAAEVGAEGPGLTLNTACSSGLNAIGLGLRLIQHGELDCAIVGGVDLLSRLTYLGFNSLGGLSPEGTRPLNTDRDGLTLGDGAAVLVLERHRAAIARGRQPLAWITGYGCAGEGHHPTAPDPEGRGAHEVMHKALATDPDPAGLSQVAAHGTGTPANDGAEVGAIQRVIAEVNVRGPVRVCALKATLGHTLGAAGALEAAVMIAAAQARLAPGTWGLTEPIPHEAPLVMSQTTEALAHRPALVVSNAFGFGGSVASLALRPLL